MMVMCQVLRAYNGSHLNVSGLQMWLRRLSDRVGFHVNPHMFRRTFATWALDNGMDVLALQRIMGHADLQMLLRYVNRKKEQLARESKEHGVVDNLS